MKFQRLIDISFALFDKTKESRTQHFSYILNKSRILAIGLNNFTKTHPQTQNYNYHPNSRIHSELSSCLKLGLTSCEGLCLVNTRINLNGHLDNSRPCLGCADLIRKLNFKACYFTDENGQFQVFEL